MKIQNVSFGDNGIKNIIDKKNSRVTTEKNGAIVDSVKISGASSGFEQVEQVLYAVETDFTPRTELIRSVSERISQGAYNTELLKPIAEKIAESPAVKDILTEVAMDNTENSDDGAEKIDLVNNQIVRGFYETQDVKNEIASRLITALGLMDFIK